MVWNRSFDSAVRGYHVYQDVWKPAAGEKLHAEQEFDNLMDKFAVKVTKNSETVGHLPREYSRISWYFLARGGKIRVEVTGRRRHCKQLCGGMEIPCRFMKLFKVQPKWTFDDIQPYIRDLEAPGQSLNALLMKFARSSADVTGVKVYNSKKPT